MRTALLDAPSCLCFQINRFAHDVNGQMKRSLCELELETELTMPVFRSSNLTCTLVDYIPVAAVSHFGQDRAGHCRALLKIQPVLISETRPATWLLTDDDTKPTPTWHIPPSFLQNMVVLLAVRSDCLQLPHFPRSRTEVAPTAPQQVDDQGFLSMLQAQPDVNLDGTSETWM